MPYINADGTVQEKRSAWRLSIISDVFWGVVNEIGLFFQTLINPTAPIPQSRIASGSHTYRPVSGGSSSSSSSSSSSGGNGGKNNTSRDRPRGPNIHTLPKQCTTNR